MSTSSARALSCQRACARALQPGRAGLIYLRTLVPEERTRWVACLRESISLYLKNQTMVGPGAGLVTVTVTPPAL